MATPPPTGNFSFDDNPTTYIDLSTIPDFLFDADFCLTWAMDINLTQKKAETIIKSFNMKKTTGDRLSRISRHILKSFFLWFLHNKYAKFLAAAKKEIASAATLVNEWSEDARVTDHTHFVQDYIDGVDYVVAAMKILIEPDIDGESLPALLPMGNMLAGVLHVKQEFFRPFFDEIDYRIQLLEKIRRLNENDTRACLYLAKTLGQKRKMENFISPPSLKEMDLLAEGHVKTEGDHSIVIELCYCLAQFLRNSRDKDKNSPFPLKLYNNRMVFRDEASVASFIRQQTTQMWNDAPDAAPLYVKLAEIHSSLLRGEFAMNSELVTPLALVNRALENYPKYSKAWHRKAKILFKLHKDEEGLACLEEAFACEETNCDALCDLIFRLMRYPNRDRLDPIFQKYASDFGENLWGKRKVGTIYYLCGNYLWMLDFKHVAVTYWLKAEESNPNPMFYFEKLYIQKKIYNWHKSWALRYEDIIQYLKGMESGEFNRYARDSLLAKLQSLLDQEKI